MSQRVCPSPPPCPPSRFQTPHYWWVTRRWFSNISLTPSLSRPSWGKAAQANCQSCYRRHLPHDSDECWWETVQLDTWPTRCTTFDQVERVLKYWYTSLLCIFLTPANNWTMCWQISCKMDSVWALKGRTIWICKRCTFLIVQWEIVVNPLLYWRRPNCRCHFNPGPIFARY